MLESLFNKFAGLQAGNLFKTSVLKDICEGLLLKFVDSKWK